MQGSISALEKVKQSYCEVNKVLTDMTILEPSYVLLTTFSTPELQKEATRLGVQQIVSKPLTLETLRNLFES